MDATTSPGLRVGEPVSILEARAGTITTNLSDLSFAIGPVDGRTVIPTSVLDDSLARRQVVVRNWFQEFDAGGR